MVNERVGKMEHISIVLSQVLENIIGVDGRKLNRDGSMHKHLRNLTKPISIEGSDRDPRYQNDFPN